MADSATSITYDGADAAAFLEMADPNILGLDAVVRSFRQACAGVDGGRFLATAFVRHWVKRAGEDPADAPRFVDEIWDDAEPAEDLRTLAIRQAKEHRADAFDLELSDNHPDRIAAMCRVLEECASDLEAWASKPRKDFLTSLTEDAPPNWPKEIWYEKQKASKHARLFVSQRPWPALSSDGVLYTFKDGAWRETADASMEAEVRSTDPEDQLDVDQVTKLVKGIHQLVNTPARAFEWIRPTQDDPKPEDLALFRNGLLNISTGQLIPHDGRYFATALPDHDWDPLAECPTWMKWLDETLDPSFHPTLQEFFGYCLTPDVRAHKFAVLLGGPRTGKSTAHGVLHSLVGSQHVDSSTMGDLSGDFGLESFLDKRVIVLPDAHDAPTGARSLALERLKSIVGSDRVPVNRKNKKAVSTVLRTRLVVTCNKMPRFIDESGALAARMLIIHFQNSFMNREDRTVPERLAMEMPGIANWALRGLLRLRSNGLKFTVGDAGRTAVELAARSQSPALQFAEARLEVTGRLDEDFTPLSAIHRAYLDWATEVGTGRSELRSQNLLADDLVAALPGKVRHTQRRFEKKQTYGLAGVKRAKDTTDFDDEAGT